MQIALEEAIGTPCTSEPLSVSRQLLHMLDLASACIHKAWHPFTQCSLFLASFLTCSADAWRNVFSRGQSGLS